MTRIDVEHVLRKVSDGLPCGSNLEYDPECVALERATQSTPEIVIGETIVEARAPDWAEVRKGAIALFHRTKDLRIGVHLARSLLLTEGLPGFRDGLQILHRLVDQYWDTVHPLLDPDDNLDPTLRVNTLAAIKDRETFLKDLRVVPLVLSRNFGPVTYRDVTLASGELKPTGDEKPKEMSAIKAAFLDCDGEALQAVASAVHEAIDLIRDIEQAVTEKVGAARAADLSDGIAALRPIARFLDERLEERGLSGPVASEEETIPSVAAVAGSGISAAASPRAVGELASRDDVVRLLDQICEYLDRSEPSSPIPLLLRRARRLVGKDFVEILRDIAPDGVAQAEHFRGAEGGQSQG